MKNLSKKQLSQIKKRALQSLSQAQKKFLKNNGIKSEKEISTKISKSS
jgi:hypothetical protein